MIDNDFEQLSQTFMSDKIKVSDEKYCDGCDIQTNKSRVCPFEKRVNNNGNSLCDCCDYCANECNDDADIALLDFETWKKIQQIL